MDEIQNCIADAQYGEALREMDTIRPVERFPSPGNDFDADAYAKACNLDLKTAVSEPLGTYMLQSYVIQCNPEDDPTIFDSISSIREYRRMQDKSSQALIERALKTLPIKFKRLNSFEQLKPGGEDSSGGVDENALEELEKHLTQEISKYWEPFKKSTDWEKYIRLKWYCDQGVKMKHFTIFRDLGRGAFGVVSGARLNTTGAMVAIKCMNKKLVKGKKALKLVQAEKDILAILGDQPSNFTVWLKYSWHDKENFYLALPLATGGDLMYHLSHNGFFNIERTAFSSAEIAMGLEHLHRLGIIYRDLKPENVLIDDKGHARISDMGLAVNAGKKKVKGRAGTPGYWAPEMIQKKRYDRSVDWWSFGCVVYELLTGRCPFSKQNSKMERDDATLTWEVTFPDWVGTDRGPKQEQFPEDGKDLILGFLNRDPEQRLGSGEGGFKAIQTHSFYGKIDWNKLGLLELDPPFVPRREAIHAANQSELDEKNQEYDYRKLKLTPEDSIPNFDYLSTFAHMNDITNVLKLEADGELQYLERAGGELACCSVS